MPDFTDFIKSAPCEAQLLDVVYVLQKQEVRVLHQDEITPPQRHWLYDALTSSLPKSLVVNPVANSAFTSKSTVTPGSLASILAIRDWLE